jgi:hypothetical protein
LYRLARARGEPMTVLVREAVERFLAEEIPLAEGRRALPEEPVLTLEVS